MTSLVVENVSVDFPIYGAQRSLRHALFARATGGLIVRGKGRGQDRMAVRALTNISLTLREGDRLGLIGHNGAGKSTLLKVMAGIYEPAAGRVLVDGKITPLFEAMPGLDGEDTGYENIVTSALIFGIRRSEIDAMLPKIEEFSELGEYLSLPVRTYSAGMTTRLGFSFATVIDPGILLMDEGISAGDARFAERATLRMKEFIGRSRIMVLASHSHDLIRLVCNKAALMHSGSLVKIGSVDEVIREYEAFVRGDRPFPEAAS